MPEWLEERVGPLKVWQWLAIVAAAGAAAIIARRALSSSDGGSTTAAGDPTQNPYAGLQATGGPGLVYTAPDASAGLEYGQDTGPETNAEWLAEVSRLQRQQATYGAAEIDTALRRYLAGSELSERQYQIVNDAINRLGPPPDGAPAIDRAEPIPSNPGPTGGSQGGNARPAAGAFAYDEGGGGEVIRIERDHVSGETVRVSNTGNARRLSEYGSAGGAPAVIDSMADVRFVGRARGHENDDAKSARVILKGSFGAVAPQFRGTLERLAAG